MAVLNAQYKQPSSAYSQGLKDLIDSMLKVDPKDRPDIHEVLHSRSVYPPAMQLTASHSSGYQNDGQGSPDVSMRTNFIARYIYVWTIIAIEKDYIRIAPWTVSAKQEGGHLLNTFPPFLVPTHGRDFLLLPRARLPWLPRWGGSLNSQKVLFI